LSNTEHQFEPTTTELWVRFCYWASVAFVALASLIVICGFAGYLWARHSI
jgi:hypothetical protein